MSVSGLVILMHEGQNFIFGQFLGVHPGLRIVNDHSVHPGPEEALRVTNTEDEDKKRTLFIYQVILYKTD